MQMPSSRAWVIAAIFSSFIAVTGALFVYFGAYNVSALEQHTRPVYTLLQIALERSIAVRSEGIEVPELSNLDRLEGVRLYANYCQQCHGAPGVGPDSFSLGMQPAPTAVATLSRERSSEEIFWSVKNGIKMSGMPAWDYRFNDEQIWEIVALVKAMATFTADEYLVLRAQALAQSSGQERSLESDAVSNTTAAEYISFAQKGRLALQQYNCSSCHEIPGVIAARSQVGPPLENVAQRAFVAGVLKNTDENLIRWIRYPQEVDPDTTMPNLKVGEVHALQMVAYFRYIGEADEEWKHPPPGERKPR